MRSIEFVSDGNKSFQFQGPVFNDCSRCDEGNDGSWSSDPSDRLEGGRAANGHVTLHSDRDDTIILTRSLQMFSGS